MRALALLALVACRGESGADFDPSGEWQMFLLVENGGFRADFPVTVTQGASYCRPEEFALFAGPWNICMDMRGAALTSMERLCLDTPPTCGDYIDGVALRGDHDEMRGSAFVHARIATGAAEVLLRRR